MTFLQRVDLLTAVGALITGVTITLFSLISTTNRVYLGVALIVPSIIFIVIQGVKREQTNAPPLFQIETPHCAWSLLSIVFLMMYACIVYLTHQMMYERPLSYFVLITISAMIVVIQIVSNRSENRNWVILVEILLISLSICASVYYLFPTVYGIDPVYHINFAQNLVEQASIPENYSAYSAYPIMHLLIGITNIVSGLDWKDTFFVMSIISTFTSVFIYLVGLKLFNSKIALLATLLYSLSNFHLYWSFWIAGTTIGSSLVLIFVYLIFLNSKGDQKRQRIILSLMILIFVSLLLAHTLSTVVCLWILMLYFTARILYSCIFGNAFQVIVGMVWNSQSVGMVKTSRGLKDYVYHLLSNQRNAISISLIILLSLLTLAYWTYNIPDSGVSFTDNIGRILKNCFLASDLGNFESVSLASEYDLLEITLSELGYAIYILFGLYGILWFLFKDNSNAQRFSLVALSVSIFFVIYSAGILGLYAIMPHRWFIFLYIFLCFFTVVGIVYMSSLLRNKITKWSFITIISGIMIFFMITSPYANSDSSIYASNLTDRYGATSSELYASQWVNEKYDHTVTTDYNYRKYFHNMQYLNPNLKMEYDMVILREYILLKWVTVPVDGGYYVTRHVPLPDNFEDFLADTYSRIYDSKKVRSYAASSMVGKVL